MKLPLQVTFRDMVPLPSLEGEIRQRAAKLEQFVPDIMSCHVTVESSGNRHHQGHRYVVRIDVHLPGAEVVAGEHHGDEDIELAMHGAFDAMGRRLEDHVRRRRGQVKQHAARARREGDEGGAPPDDAAR